jgi:soluble lytic murein transglycosylase-like protein
MQAKAAILFGLATCWWFSLGTCYTPQRINQDDVKIIKRLAQVNPALGIEDLLRIKDFVFKHSHTHAVDPMLVFGMIWQESRYKILATSSYGAVGLMQVVPRWHQDKIQGRDLFDVDVNISVGVQILRNCLEKHKFKTEHALACYSGYSASTVSKYLDPVMKFRNQLLKDVR